MPENRPPGGIPTKGDVMGRERLTEVAIAS